MNRIVVGPMLWLALALALVIPERSQAQYLVNCNDPAGTVVSCYADRPISSEICRSVLCPGVSQAAAPPPSPGPSYSIPESTMYNIVCDDPARTMVLCYTGVAEATCRYSQCPATAAEIPPDFQIRLGELTQRVEELEAQGRVTASISPLAPGKASMNVAIPGLGGVTLALSIEDGVAYCKTPTSLCRRGLQWLLNAR